MADFNRLDGTVKKRIFETVCQTENNPRYGDALGNKAGIQLEGHFKLYADKKRIRIIYQILDDIIKVIAVDKWEDIDVYRIAVKRIISMQTKHTKQTI